MRRLLEGMMNWDGGHHWQWGAAAGIFMVLIWLIVVTITVMLVRWLLQTRPGNTNSADTTSGNPGNEAARILDERLARGEISVAEYRERSAALAERRSR